MRRKSNLFIAILILLVIVEGAVIVNSSRDRKQKTPGASVAQTQQIKTFFVLDLPKEYFPKDPIDQRAVYQSYPTTNTTIGYYSSEVVPLLYQSMESIKQKIAEIHDVGSAYEDSAVKNFKKYGSLATYYLPANYIVSVEKFDVDGDGLPESIVAHRSLDSASGGLYMSDIIKGNNIIFVTQSDSARIVKADTNNGFFVEWQNESLNWYDGFVRTRFVWKDNQFVPVYEQEVRFIKM